jgi:hypothetical protein
MTEFQNIATGLLGLTHPEVYQSVRNKADKPAQTGASTAAHDSASELDSTPAGPPDPSASYAGAVFRAVKLAFAALVAGSRAVPLGDNGQLTRELGAYAARLRY